MGKNINGINQINIIIILIESIYSILLLIPLPNFFICTVNEKINWDKKTHAIVYDTS